MRIIDLSHTLGTGDKTYKGLPPIHICDYLSREESRDHYEDGTEFQIDKITLIGNSGTYIDSPFHRYSDGKDLSALALAKTTNLPGIVIRAPYLTRWSAIGIDCLEGKHLEGKAVLFDTGWCKHFGTEDYTHGHPFLTAEAAEYLRKQKVALVGIDSHNIDDIRVNARPSHSILLGADIPIVEHMTNLSALPDQGFRFFAAPIKLKNVGTFPTRAFAILE